MTWQAKRAAAKGAPERDDVHMDGLLARSRFLLARDGIDPDNLPWRWVGKRLECVATGRTLAQAPRRKYGVKFYDEWRHKVQDDRYSRRLKGIQS